MQWQTLQRWWSSVQYVLRVWVSLKKSWVLTLLQVVVISLKAATNSHNRRRSNYTKRQWRKVMELEEPLASFKSAVWEHFGFLVQYTGDGTRVEDRTKAVCWRCFTKVRYVAGNASNMLTHSLVQQLIPAAFKSPLDINTDRVKGKWKIQLY